MTALLCWLLHTGPAHLYRTLYLPRLALHVIPPAPYFALLLAIPGVAPRYTRQSQARSPHGAA